MITEIAIIEFETHVIENTVNAIGDAISDAIDAIKSSSTNTPSITDPSGEVLNNPSISGSVVISMPPISNDIYQSKERKRGRDSGLIGYGDDELKELLKIAKAQGDMKLVQRIIAELKNVDRETKENSVVVHICADYGCC